MVSFLLRFYFVYSFTHADMGVNPGGWRVATPEFRHWGRGGLHEILLNLIMYRNMIWKHFPKWWLLRN